MSRIAGRYARRRAGRPGFTLTEVAISVAVVAGLTAAIVVGVNATSSSASDDASRYASEADGLRATLGAASAGFGDTSRLVQLEGASLSYGSPLTFDLAQASTTFSPTLSGTPLTGAVSYQLASGQLPEGVSFDPVSGDLTVTPSELQRQQFAEAGAAFDLGEASGAVSYAAGADGQVYAVALLPDGKILIGGSFYDVDDVRRSVLARLNADGTVDTSFNATWPTPREVHWVIALPDGKILSGGRTDGSSPAIVRKNADGTNDATFNGGSIDVWKYVFAAAALPDGKILIGGDFTTVDGTSRNRIARLNADGSLDTSFNPGTGASSTVRAIEVLPDGKILIGGDFTTVHGTSRNRIARLNADGSLDTSFNPGTGASSTVRAIEVLPDGKILIGGSFGTVSGTSRNCIARLNANGSLDTSFNPGTGASSTVRAIEVLSDGKIMIGGEFTTVNGTSRNRIARLDANGSLDTTFGNGLAGANNSVNVIEALPDGKIMMLGGFTTVNTVYRSSFALLDADGGLDTAFSAAADGVRDGASNSAEVSSLAVQPDGKIVIGGNFSTVNGASRVRIARLNADGTLDTTFGDGLAGASSRVRAVAVLPDGKILIGGEFTTVNGTSRNRIARLNADGSLDTSFNPGTGANSHVRAVALQPDGKIVIGGNFSTVNGTSRGRIARLNADGSLDTSFNPGTGASSTVHAIEVLSDGKILIGGDFTTVNGTSRNRIARLNADGSLDTTFGNGLAGADGRVQAVAVQPDGKIVIGGDFNAVNGDTHWRVARLNVDGSLDVNFDTASMISSSVYMLAVLPDGRILVGGTARIKHSPSTGETTNHIFRLEADGSRDATYSNGVGNGSGYVYALAVQPDGKILIGGLYITTFNGTPRAGIARLEERLTELPFTASIAAISPEAGYQVSSGPLIFNAAG